VLRIMTWQECLMDVNNRLTVDWFVQILHDIVHRIVKIIIKVINV